MPSSAPPTQSILLTSALGLGLESFVAVQAAEAAGIADARASFQYTLAAPTPSMGFFVLAGLEPLVDAVERFRFKSDELTWLESSGAIESTTRKRLGARMSCDMHAPAEGTIVFPGETLLTIEGPFWQAQLLSSLVKSALGEATLAATRIARMGIAGAGAEIIEHGAASMHRLGGNPLLARAAYIGGATATTNALAGRRHGIPVCATQPERSLLASPRSYEAWLAAAPNRGILRIDDPSRVNALVQAVRGLTRHTGWGDATAAIEVSGGEHAEIAAAILRGFAEEKLTEPLLIASGALDEAAIAELRQHTPAFGAFAVTSFVPYDTEALGAYDLVAIEEGGSWSPRSRDPGRKMLIRYSDEGGSPVADVAHLTTERILRARDVRFVDRAPGATSTIANAQTSSPLLTTMLRAGKRVTSPEPTLAIRERAQQGIALLGAPYKRLTRPARYPVGATAQLAALRAEAAGEPT